MWIISNQLVHVFFGNKSKKKRSYILLHGGSGAAQQDEEQWQTSVHLLSFDCRTCMKTHIAKKPELYQTASQSQAHFARLSPNPPCAVIEIAHNKGKCRTIPVPLLTIENQMGDVRPPNMDWSKPDGMQRTSYSSKKHISTAKM